jgi:glycosyltransferase involved in cell wall biosynthesis
LEEVGPEKRPGNLAGPLRLFYGGSLSRERLPWAVLQVILGFGGKVSLDLVGYPNYEDRDYPDAIQTADEGRGVLRYHGALPQRGDLFRVMDECEAAFCLMPMRSRYSGMEQMAGASNKPFDAMARGLAVVVSDIPDWKRLYLPGENHNCGKEYWISDVGYGIAINPECEESIRGGLEWMLGNREKLWEMGERGRQKIQKEWNYERMFAPVLTRLEIK